MFEESLGFLDELTRMAGIRYAAVILPDANVYTASKTGKALRDDTVWLVVKDAYEKLQLNDLSSDRLCWVYEKVCVVALLKSSFIVIAVIDRERVGTMEPIVKEKLRQFVHFIQTQKP